MEFWIGLIIGGFISIITSFVANLYTPNLFSMLEGRRAVSQLKQRKNAELFDRWIREFRSGRRNITFWYARVVAFYAVALLGTLICLIGAFVAMSPVIPPTFSEWVLDSGKLLTFGPREAIATVWLVLSIGHLHLALGIRKYLYRVPSILEDFETYEREYKQKWSIQ